MFTGNRGCVVDDTEAVVRHHRGSLWITCVLRYKDWRVPLARPNRWTPMFFLDDAVSLAAGHRPCGLCRRADYLSYQAGVTRWLDADAPVGATELNRRLALERLRRGSGVSRRRDRKIWTAQAADLPDGTVILDDASEPRLVNGNRTLAFSFAGWHGPAAVPRGAVHVLTPPTSVGALRDGYLPTLHDSARESE